jgi:hypothetical protein
VNERFAIAANGMGARFTRDVADITMELNALEEIDVASLGSDGNDVLIGGDGIDTILGGPGTTSCAGGRGWTCSTEARGTTSSPSSEHPRIRSGAVAVRLSS